jgi:hypothetical protein
MDLRTEEVDLLVDWSMESSQELHASNTAYLIVKALKLQFLLFLYCITLFLLKSFFFIFPILRSFFSFDALGL